jgi:hypothetical protein
VHTTSTLLPLATTRPRRALTATVAAAATAATLIAGVAPASASGTAWRAVPLPTLGAGTLDGLSALGPSNAWAVGSQIPTNDAIVLHWNGTAWSTGPTTGIPAGVTLQGVDARSDRDILADGFDTSSGNNVVYRFNGSAWTLLPRPSTADTGFAPFGASFGPGGQIWAEGSVSGLPAFFKLTSAGWKTYPTGVTVRGIVGDPLFVTPDDAWSIGFTGLGTSAFSPLLLHFNGRTWSQVPAPPLPPTAVSGTLSGIVAAPGGRLWLSGNWQPCSFFSVCANTPFVARGRPGAWKSEPLPSGVTAIAGLSPDRAGRPQWMTATTSDTGSSYYLHFHGGAWTLVPGVAIPGEVQPSMTVVHIPGSNSSWAVGWAHNGPLISSLVPRIEVNGALP